jgi:hypothetical protein
MQLPLAFGCCWDPRAVAGQPGRLAGIAPQHGGTRGGDGLGGLDRDVKELGDARRNQLMTLCARVDPVDVPGAVPGHGEAAAAGYTP